MALARAAAIAERRVTVDVLDLSEQAECVSLSAKSSKGLVLFGILSSRCQRLARLVLVQTPVIDVIWIRLQIRDHGGHVLATRRHLWLNIYDTGSSSLANKR
jgi:hypothetical protein